MASSVVTRHTSYTGLGTRVILTLVGAAGLIVGAFLDWTSSVLGTQLSYRALWSNTFGRSENFTMTAGFVAIVLGLAAVVGLAFSEGWLTRLAGALGIVVFAVFAIQIYRTQGVETIGAGAWIALAGAFVVLVAGFFGVRETVEETQPREEVVER